MYSQGYGGYGQQQTSSAYAPASYADPGQDYSYGRYQDQPSQLYGAGGPSHVAQAGRRAGQAPNGYQGGGYQQQQQAGGYGGSLEPQHSYRSGREQSGVGASNDYGAHQQQQHQQQQQQQQQYGYGAAAVPVASAAAASHHYGAYTGREITQPPGGATHFNIFSWQEPATKAVVLPRGRPRGSNGGGAKGYGYGLEAPIGGYGVDVAGGYSAAPSVAKQPSSNFGGGADPGLQAPRYGRRRAGEEASAPSAVQGGYGQAPAPAAYGNAQGHSVASYGYAAPPGQATPRLAEFGYRVAQPPGGRSQIVFG